MNLFSTIAAVALAGASFIANAPAEAQYYYGSSTTIGGNTFHSGYGSGGSVNGSTIRVGGTSFHNYRGSNGSSYTGTLIRTGGNSFSNGYYNY